MDYRWTPINRDSKREVRVILHPTAAIWEVRRGIYDSGSDDSVDLTDFVTQASHSAFDATVAFSFNRELFGTKQPAPNQVLEIQLKQKDKWLPIWIGIVEGLNQFTMQRGTRSMQLIAKSRDSQDIWRNTKRITPLYPQMTDIVEIAKRVARSAGMKGDEILLPPSGILTGHSNTQLADMNAWDMVTQLFLPLGWTPFVDSVGRLRAADRSLQGRRPDVKLEDARVIKVGGSRQRPPATRVRVRWLNPQLKKYIRQGQLLRTETFTVGWWFEKWERELYFSDDKTLRVENAKLKIKESANTWSKIKFVDETFIQQAPNKGKLKLKNKQWMLMYPAVATWIAMHLVPDLHTHTHIFGALGVGVSSGVTQPPMPPTVQGIGRKAESVAGAAMMFALIMVGTGTYEIYGNPYDWVHARNTSEAFDSSVPPWVDRAVDIESDFIVNEEHGRAVATRELIFQAQAANKWTVTLVDDPRIEFGDILQFVDGSQLYVEDFTRSLERGAEAVLDVQGFLIKPAPKVVAGAAIDAPPPIPVTPPDGGYVVPPDAPPGDTGSGGGGGDTGGGGGGEEGGGGGGGTPGGGTPTVELPNLHGVVADYMSAHPDELANSCQNSGGSWALMEGLVSALSAASGGRVGFNGKRGGSERSHDAIAYYYGEGSPTEGSHDVYVVDIVGGHCGPTPGPSWNNVSEYASGAWYSSH